MNRSEVQRSARWPSVDSASLGGVAVTLLGGFVLHQGDREVELQPSVQRLVAFLALHDGPVQRTYLASVLWPDASESRAVANLRTALWRAGDRFALVHATPTHLSLDPDLSVDVRRATALARSVLDHRERRAAAAESVSAEITMLLVRAADELLPAWYEEWVLIERERYRQTRLNALEALCRERSGAGEYADAVEAGLAAVAAEPLRESAHRALMAAHLDEGNAVEAIRQYRAFCRVLHAELRLAPSPRIRALADRAVGRAGDGAVTAPR